MREANQQEEKIEEELELVEEHNRDKGQAVVLSVVYLVVQVGSRPVTLASQIDFTLLANIKLI